jgi:hypothetical protein
VNETGRHLIAGNKEIGDGTDAKKSACIHQNEHKVKNHYMIVNNNRSSTKKEKTSCLKFFSFLAGVVDTVEQPLLSNISIALSIRPPKAAQVSLLGLDCALCTLHADASCTMLIPEKNPLPDIEP